MEIPDLEERTTPQSPDPIASPVASPGSGYPSRSRYSESPTTFAQALDRSETERMRIFHAFSALASLVVLILSLALLGDAHAKHFFQAGMCWLGLTNAATWWFARSKRAWGARFMSTFWPMGALGFIPGMYYFGPFSAAVLVFPLGIMFVALGRDTRTAAVVLGLSLFSHLLVAVPIIVGWTTDVGILHRMLVGRGPLAMLEALILVLMTSALTLGRWARQAKATALSELADAKRIIGDQKQVIVEVEYRMDQVDRVQTGRWTGQTIGRWNLGAVLGRGAMGEVYEARDVNGEVAAVKVLTAAAEASPALVERFHRELQIAARLDTPHVVKVLGTSSSDAIPFLAMERLRGEDLARRLRTEVRMPLREVVSMIEQVANGLEVAHAAGVVHRDLKPHNLFLHDAMCWKILDFGVAKLFGVEGTLTHNALIGTPQYMAPEQAAGGQVTHLSDIYALGAIVYRCLTGRPPHQATSLAPLIHKVVRTAPARPGTLVEIRQTVEDVLAVAMAKDPRERFASAQELFEQLSAAAAGRHVDLQPPEGAWAFDAESSNDAPSSGGDS